MGGSPSAASVPSSAEAHGPSHFFLAPLSLPRLQDFTPGGSSLFPAGLALPEPTPLAAAAAAAASGFREERGTFYPLPRFYLFLLSFLCVPLYPLPPECHSSLLSDSFRSHPFIGLSGALRAVDWLAPAERR